MSGEVAFGCGGLGECTVSLQAGNAVFIVTGVLRIFSRLTSNSVNPSARCYLRSATHKGLEIVVLYSLVSCTTKNMRYVCLWYG